MSPKLIPKKRKKSGSCKKYFIWIYSSTSWKFFIFPAAYKTDNYDYHETDDDRNNIIVTIRIYYDKIIYENILKSITLIKFHSSLNLFFDYLPEIPI